MFLIHSALMSFTSSALISVRSYHSCSPKIPLIVKGYVVPKADHKIENLSIGKLIFHLKDQVIVLWVLDKSNICLNENINKDPALLMKLR